MAIPPLRGRLFSEGVLSFMKLIRPDYYDRFRCLAGACPDSCCRYWDVQVDAASAEYYRSLPGALGDLCRRSLVEEEGEIYMAAADDRCPMWRQDGLCRLQAELGEAALCEVCTRFPRLTHDYGTFTEMDLELSCPAAAELILQSADHPRITELLPGGEPGDYEADDMECLLAARETALAILNDPDISAREALARLLLFGAAAQEALDLGCEPAWDPAAAMETARALAGEGDAAALRDCFLELEILTEDWRQMLRSRQAPVFPKECLALAAYLVNRRWLQAVSDLDLMSRVKFTVAACILVGSLPGSYARAAQLFSKEIENDADNTDALLDAAWTHPGFTDANLLGILLK